MKVGLRRFLHRGKAALETPEMQGRKEVLISVMPEPSLPRCLIFVGGQGLLHLTPGGARAAGARLSPASRLPPRAAFPSAAPESDT